MNQWEESEIESGRERVSKLGGGERGEKEGENDGKEGENDGKEGEE